ncbi:hypothetical protein [Sphingomonas endophytica]|uniref:Circumsporozoite protein n=1 Tax=Sphingomonas endophytica TaxID=869719 RepID=A0A147I1L9_9SPHN|nr:hypothetical protein [Sphingomonas endophytica]KTT71486.1 hypothetical protein NS334_10420 [Sphingomonas endophytica]
MKKIVAGLSVAALALALAACGSKTDDAAVNAQLGNEAVLNDELPADANLALGNGDEAALPANVIDGNTATANAL